MRDGHDSDAVADRPFWQQRGWQVSAGFLALVLLVGAIAAVSSRDDRTGTGHATAGPLAQGGGAAGSRPGGCRTDDAGQSVPVRPPDDVTWRQLNGAPIPLSASAGPLRQSGPVLWCFAHTPMGAVMAANIIPRQMSGSDWQTVAEQQIVPGFERDLFVAMRSSDHEITPQYTANSPAGFMLTSYSPQAATVSLLIKSPPALYGSTDITVAWSGGDWKLQVLADADLYTPVTEVTTTAGFVMWKV